jgi:fatty acid desaturase
MIEEFLIKRGDGVSLLRILIHLSLVFSPLIIIIAFPFRFLDVPLIVLFGLLMNGVLNLMHETAHCHVFEGRGYNQFLGKRILGPLFFANFSAYTNRHWEHHKFLGTNRDPKDIYLLNIQGKKVLLYFLSCLAGCEALKKFFGQMRAKTDPAKSEKGWIYSLLLFQTFFFLVLFFISYLFQGNFRQAVSVCLYVYLVGYVFSVMSITNFAAGLRAIIEHQPTPGDAVRNGHAAIRNFDCSVVSRIIFGSYGFGEHLTHHEYPAIPCYQLQAATFELGKSHGKYIPGDDYPKVLLQIVFQSK